MKLFEMPAIEVVAFAVEDVITTSAVECPAYDPNAGDEDEF